MSWIALAERIAERVRVLSCRLAKCGIAADEIPRVAERLSRPPLIIGLSACDDPKPGAAIQLTCGKLGKFAPPKRAFDCDGAAVLLRYHEGRPDYSRATWKMLSRAERKRAQRLHDWFGSNHGLSVTPQGAPPQYDPALVLYLMRVLCEATGRPEFPRLSTTAGKLSSPMWRALSEALPLAQSFLARRYRDYGTPAIGRRLNADKKRESYKIDKHIEGAAELIRVIRSKPFNDFCRSQNLGASADDVAASATTFRLAIASARQSRMRKRLSPALGRPSRAA
jgi:hypothetical protein